MAAAILYGEIARAMLDAHRARYGLISVLSPDDRRQVTQVVNSGLRFFDDAGRTPLGEQLGDEPRRSWYYAVASSFVASILLPEAQQVIEIGLAEFRNDPQLLTARGALAAGHPRFVYFHSTKSAMADYKRAVALAPDLTIAKLRLGQLYVDLGSGREARGLLQSVAAGASTDDQQYLAHLLLGRVAAMEHDLEQADAEYRKAYSVGAGYQAACIALSRNENALEHPEKAAGLAEDCFRLSDHDDPWAYYHAMGDPDALPHLRAEARGQ
jgi:tetratricopeptide (TPR) repeat protein